MYNFILIVQDTKNDINHITCNENNKDVKAEITVVLTSITTYIIGIAIPIRIYIVTNTHMTRVPNIANWGVFASYVYFIHHMYIV